MPKAISLSLTVRCACTVAAILSLSGIILSLCSYCLKKGLVYIALASPLSQQLSFCLEYTKVNMQLSCDVRLVSDAKCTFYIYLCLYSIHSSSGNTWCHTGLLVLFYTL